MNCVTSNKEDTNILLLHLLLIIKRYTMYNYHLIIYLSLFTIFLFTIIISNHYSVYCYLPYY